MDKKKALWRCKMKNTSLKSIIVLVSICLVIGALMAAVNLVTAPKIDEANQKAEQEALAAVLPENGGFEKLEGVELPESMIAFYYDKDAHGSVAMLSIKGYDSSKPMSVAVGFTDRGEIAAIKVISVQGETTGIGTKVANDDFLARFTGKTAENINGVDTISGATISSSAFKNAVAEAAQFYLSQCDGEVK